MEEEETSSSNYTTRVNWVIREAYGPFTHYQDFRQISVEWHQKLKPYCHKLFPPKSSFPDILFSRFTLAPRALPAPLAKGILCKNRRRQKKPPQTTPIGAPLLAILYLRLLHAKRLSAPRSSDTLGGNAAMSPASHSCSSLRPQD